MKKEKKSAHSLATRITCIVMAALVSSGILVYLAMFFMEMFAK